MKQNESGSVVKLEYSVAGKAPATGFNDSPVLLYLGISSMLLVLRPDGRRSVIFVIRYIPSYRTH